MPKITIVIPVFNEEFYISDILKAVLNADTQKMPKEIIIINDASTDHTLEKIHLFLKQSKFNRDQNKIKIFEQAIQQGKGAALKKAFLQSTGDIVLVQDADLEYNPSDYQRLLLPFLKYQADVVYGSRFVTEQPRRVLYFWHYLVNIFLTTFSNFLTNLNLTDMETGYKVFKGDLIRQIAPQLKSKRFGFEPEITARIAKQKKLKIYEVGISYHGRTYEEGKKIGWKDGFRAIWEIIYFNLFTA